MRRSIFVWGVVCGLFLMLSGSKAFAADKFAYIDLSKTLGEYHKTKDYDKTLTDKQNAYNNERDKLIAEVKQLQDKMNLMSDKEKDAKRDDFEKKVKNLQEFDRQKQADLRKEQDEKMQELLKDINDTIKQLADKEGYTMVFNDRVLVYQDKTLDITDKVIELINKGKSSKK
ncbi:MAG: OmpH family outer membrane protein [Candidatus Omnitrophica bacterium]|jgi:outer membrane protein|nr:OmpH family outer membrane protein [Candidatus Omnitrophota bacterium]MDD5079913.1 OmpH family outer membrane protein [Candidatus Omnitrophota bacterium]